MNKMITKENFNTALISVVLCIVIDRLLKSTALNFFQNKQLEIIPQVLSFEYFANYNIALSLKTGFNPIIIIIPITILLIFILIKSLKENKLKESSAWLFITAGATANLYDRIVYGHVVDYLNFFNLTVINLADVMIVLGIIYLIYLKKT